MELPETMQGLVHCKKIVTSQLNETNSPEINLVLQQRLDEISRRIEQKTNRHDQNFMRTFYRIAKEGLPSAVFDRLEDVTHTRMKQRSEQSKDSNNDE
ncbi:hypothetical protein [Acinetobacter ursingii]|uniref:hypothetical protein n=1 Tax=Acinetobacter ursingii TaxID=108980 RepID=UPI001250A225|nr:hypothetical protein [Acinetobacter ursingii]